MEQQIGRAEAGEDTFGTHMSEFHIELKPTRAEEEEGVQADIRKTFASFPGVQSEVMTFSGRPHSRDDLRGDGAGGVECFWR